MRWHYQLLFQCLVYKNPDLVNKLRVFPILEDILAFKIRGKRVIQYNLYYVRSKIDLLVNDLSLESVPLQFPGRWVIFSFQTLENHL